jgi:transposase
MTIPDDFTGRFYRTKEAATILSLSFRTLEKHRTYGTGPKFSKLGGRVVYKIEDLHAWASRGSRRSTSDEGQGVGLPILLKVTEGQAHDARSAQGMLGTLGRGDILLADSSYDSDVLRQDLAARGARVNVNLLPNSVNLPPFSKHRYRKRNLIERFFNKLRHFRAVATRYDKRDDNYLACVKLASIRIWMRFNESVA